MPLKFNGTEIGTLKMGTTEINDMILNNTDVYDTNLPVLPEYEGESNGMPKYLFLYHSILHNKVFHYFYNNHHYTININDENPIPVDLGSFLDSTEYYNGLTSGIQSLSANTSIYDKESGIFIIAAPNVHVNTRGTFKKTLDEIKSDLSKARKMAGLIHVFDLNNNTDITPWTTQSISSYISDYNNATYNNIASWLYSNISNSGMYIRFHNFNFSFIPGSIDTSSTTVGAVFFRTCHQSIQKTSYYMETDLYANEIYLVSINYITGRIVVKNSYKYGDLSSYINLGSVQYNSPDTLSFLEMGNDSNYNGYIIPSIYRKDTKYYGTKITSMLDISRGYIWYNTLSVSHPSSASTYDISNYRINNDEIYCGDWKVSKISNQYFYIFRVKNNTTSKMYLRFIRIGIGCYYDVDLSTVSDFNIARNINNAPVFNISGNIISTIRVRSISDKYYNIIIFGKITISNPTNSSINVQIDWALPESS